MTLAEIFPKHGTAIGAVIHQAGPTLDEIRSWPATVSVAEAAGALGASRSWLYQLIAQGEAPCRVIKIGGSRARVVTSSLISLLETGQP